MITPNELSYTKTHEWIKFLDDGSALIGLTDHAQDVLGDLVFIDLPDSGVSIEAGESFSDIESVKAVSEVYSPVSGTIAEVNESLADTPELMNTAPYESWIVKVSNITHKTDLMSAAQYTAFVEEGE